MWKVVTGKMVSMGKGEHLDPTVRAEPVLAVTSIIIPDEKPGF